MLLIDNHFINKYFKKLVDEFYLKIDKENIIDDKSYFFSKALEDLSFILNSFNTNDLFKLEDIVKKYFINMFESIKSLNKLYYQDKNTKIYSIVSYKNSTNLVTLNNNKKFILDKECSDIENIFYIMLKWLNKNNKKYNHLYIPNIIKNEDNTLKEYIEYRPCKNKQQEEKFYLKCGELLALLYILNITNIKKENIIVIGENPVVTNFETITPIEPIKSLFCDEIATAILESSIYNMSFFEIFDKNLMEEEIDYIKEGFELVYNIVLQNKVELITLLKENIDSNYNLVSIIAKIQVLNNKDLKRQISFIDAKFLKRNNYNNKIKFSNDDFLAKLDRGAILDVATNIGDYIIERGIIGYKDSRIERTWISVLENGRVSIIGNNLYEGNNGIALFLAFLGAISKKEYFVESALEALEPVIRDIEKINKDTDLQLGAFKGVSGTFYTLAKIYKLTGKESIKDFIKSNISILYRLADDKNINVMDGSAGVIAILTCIYNDIDDSDIKDTIRVLIEVAYRNVIVEVRDLEDKETLTVGFAYGLSGILAYLSKLLSVKHSKDLEDNIAYILKIERKIYQKEKNSLKNNWLNGCGGILLSRLMLKDSGYNDELLDYEIDDLINITINKGLGDNPYYAYGQIGNLEILNYAAKVSNNEQLKNRCINTYNNIIRKSLDKSLYGDNDYDMEPISFLSGLAGIGYTLIQKYDEELVPQILFFS